MPAKVSISKVAYKTLKLKGSPDFLAADGDDVWALNNDRIEKLSVASDKPVLTVNVPGACGALVVGYNSVWVASCRERSVYRINIKTGKVLAKIPCGVADPDGEISLAVGSGSLWILSDKAGTLTRISAKINKVETEIKVMPDSYCAVYGFGAVWITNTKNNSVQRIDPKKNEVAATIKVGETPRFLAAGENGIWTLNQEKGTVSHINPKTNKEIAVIDAKVPGTGGDIAAGGGHIWVRAKSRLLQTINPASNKIETIYTPTAGSGAVRVANHFVWVTAHDIETIWVLKT